MSLISCFSCIKIRQSLASKKKAVFIYAARAEPCVLLECLVFPCLTGTSQ
jgi:hypothetical protein